MAQSRIISRAIIKAREIINDLNILYPDEICIEDISFYRGAIVKTQLLKNYEGRLVRGKRKGIITYNSEIREPGKKRFVIAHELGHFELEKKQKDMFSCTVRDFQLWNKSQKDVEQAANEFASELLMPEKIFKQAEAKQPFGFETIKHLAAEFQTSLTASGIRYVQLSGETCALVYTEARKIRWFFPSLDFDYFIPVKDYVSENSYAFNFFNEMKIPDEFISIRADAWLSSATIDQNAQIKEHTISFPNYDATLTLLWVDEDLNS
ncbi:ImmA/IrrE family metallo-endopeptidase [bacterium]|nr:ImmA/IrrE family metallo-endopeptidase [bacterium]